MRPRVVDTSVLLASVAPDEPHHGDSLRLLAEPGPLVIPNEVLIETLGVITHRNGRPAAKRFLRALEETEGVEMDHASDVREALALCKKRRSLSVVDAVGVVMAWRMGCDLDTWDRLQKRVWGAGESA